MIGNTRENFTQIGLRVDAVELGRPDEAIDHGGALTASVGAGEEIVLATERDGDLTPDFSATVR
jgi:hypothetical protein